MKKLFKVLGITIALTTVAAVIKAKDRECITLNLDGHRVANSFKSQKYYPYTKSWWKQKII